MNIALVFHGCHRRGGVERSVWELARHLANRHDTTVYASDIDREGLGRVRCVQIPTTDAGALRPVRFASRARAAIAKDHHDHVISFGVGNVGADVLWVNSVHRAWLRQSLRLGTGAGLHRVPALRYLIPRHQVLRWAERRYFTSSDPQAIVVVADAVGDDVRRLYGIPPTLVSTIHNGFSADEFSPQRRRDLRREARAELGYSDTDVVALMAANELPRKGFDVLVEAQAAVPDNRLHVVLCGRAQPGANHESRIAALGLSDRVRYIGVQSDIGRIHAASDLFVLPTRYEAFSLAIVEALASGLPVITTKVQGAMDRIVDGRNGRLLDDPRDVPSLTMLLSEALDDRTRVSWSEHAPESVADLSWSSIADQAEKLLEGLPPMRRR